MTSHKTQWLIFISILISTLIPKSINSFNHLFSPPPWVQNIPEKIQAGDVLSLRTPSSLPSLSLFIDEKPMTFLSRSNRFIGSVDLYSQPYIKIKGFWRNTQSQWIWFQRKIHVQKLPLSKAKPLRLPAQVWNKVGEQKELQKIKERKKTQILWSRSIAPLKTSCFTLPINSVEISPFGSPRTLPNGQNYYHTGVDLRARTGNDIKSIGAGRVVLADYMIVPGRNIIIDHGGGIFSRYMHLSEIGVYVGQNISQQQIIGKAGDTGRVQASHLHWEVLWKGRSLAPKKFIQRWPCKKS